MTVILEGCELWFARLDPKRPNADFNPKNPTWEVQLRTTDKEVKKYWESLDMSVKAIVPDDDNEKPYFRCNLKKRSIKSDGSAASPVKVVNGDLEPVDPNSIGNKSIGNIRVFQYEYTNKAGEKKMAPVLMGIQLTTHILYVPKPREDDFEKATTTTIRPVDAPEAPDDNDDVVF
jgi:hypothetical protein